MYVITLPEEVMFMAMDAMIDTSSKSTQKLKTLRGARFVIEFP